MIASIGQSVSIGAPIAEFTSKQPQIIIDIEPSLVASLGVGQTVSVLVAERTLTGVISALSSVANTNLLSTIRISLPGGRDYIGESALISFSPKGDTNPSTSLTLPLSAVSIIAE